MDKSQLRVSDVCCRPTIYPADVLVLTQETLAQMIGADSLGRCVANWLTGGINGLFNAP